MTETKKDQIKILVMVIVAQLSFIPMIVYGSATDWIISFLIYFFMFGLGVSLFNHRVLSHKSVLIKNKFLKYFLLFWSTVMLQGSTMAWVVMHREHHAHSDTENDPHSPVEGFWKSYWLSMMHTPNIRRYGIDLLRDKDLLNFHKYFWHINFVYSLILFLFFGWFGIIVFHLVPAALTWHGVSIVNAVSHAPIKLPMILGYRNYNTNENSKNIPLAGYLTFGEAWHNNHHGKPSSFTFQSKWWEFDIIALCVVFLQYLNLVEIKT